ncbi:GSCOCG00010460001-RA-CDS [Cotesia congregata]|nr:GSCOCG00010460001-RA-CDS [Cotesia congregata]
MTQVINYVTQQNIYISLFCTISLIVLQEVVRNKQNMKTKVLCAVAIIAFSCVISTMSYRTAGTSTYDCFPGYMKIDFNRRTPLHEVTLSTNSFQTPGCSKKFMPGEPAVMEINFEKCTEGAENFKLNVGEYKPGEMDQSLYSLDIYCENKPVA